MPVKIILRFGGERREDRRQRDRPQDCGDDGRAASPRRERVLGSDLSAMLWISAEPSARTTAGTAIAAHPEAPWFGADTGPSSRYGPWLLALLTSGLLCHGLFCLIEARYRDQTPGH
jgi:hypothetical protein